MCPARSWPGGQSLVAPRQPLTTPPGPDVRVRCLAPPALGSVPGRRLVPLQEDISDIPLLEPRAMELLRRDLIVDIAEQAEAWGKETPARALKPRRVHLPWNLKRHQHFNKDLGWRQPVFIYSHGHPSRHQYNPRHARTCTTSWLRRGWQPSVPISNSLHHAGTTRISHFSDMLPERRATSRSAALAPPSAPPTYLPTL